MNIFRPALTIFIVMDPLGNIPVFLSILKTVDPKKRMPIILRESIIALITLLLFLLGGHQLMHSLQVTTPALEISGGVILFLIALKMIFPSESSKLQEAAHGEPFIVPLAIPLVAGPATMATVMLYASQFAGDTQNLALAIIAAWVPTTIILLVAGRLQRYLGDKGLVAIERLMGMVVITVAVQMFLSGIQVYFGLPVVVGA